MARITLNKAKKLISQWSKGTLPTVAKSIKYYFVRHGKEVSAADVWQYLRKAEAFERNLRGARTSILRNYFSRYMKTVIILSKTKQVKLFRSVLKDKSYDR